MADSLVQQDSRTARTHYNRHFTTFRFDGFKQNGCSVYYLTGNHVYNIICHKLKASAIRPAGITVLHFSVFFHDTNGHERRHRAVIVIADTFRITKQHMRRTVLQVCLHLPNATIQRKDFLIQLFQIRNLFFYAYVFPGNRHSITVLRYRLLRQSNRHTRLTRRRNTGGSACGTQHFFQSNTFYVRITAPISGQYAHSHTKIYVGAAIVYLTIHQTHIVIERMLKIKVCVIPAFFQSSRHYFP